MNRFFSLPIMIGSKFCTSNFFEDIITDDNLGGYFIVNGK